MTAEAGMTNPREWSAPRQDHEHETAWHAFFSRDLNISLFFFSLFLFFSLSHSLSRRFVHGPSITGGHKTKIKGNAGLKLELYFWKYHVFSKYTILDNLFDSRLFYSSVHGAEHYIVLCNAGCTSTCSFLDIVFVIIHILEFLCHFFLKYSYLPTTAILLKTPQGPRIFRKSCLCGRTSIIR